MLLGLLSVLGLNLVANLGLAVVVVVFACDLTVFLNLVLVLVLGAEVALLLNLDELRERVLGLDILVVLSGTSEGACLLKAVWCLEEEEGLLTELLEGKESSSS